RPERPQIAVGAQRASQAELRHAIGFIRRHAGPAVDHGGRNVIEAVVEDDDVGASAASQLQLELKQLLREDVAGFSEIRHRDGPAEGALATIDRFEGYPESEREAADGPCRANSHAAAREPRPSSLLRCCRTGRYHCRSHATAWGRERSPGAAV